MSKDKKIRLLCFSDSPIATTGFGRIMKEILGRLHATGMYDIEIVGKNHLATWYDQKEYPYKIHPASMAGNGDGFDMFRALLNGQEWDLVYVQEDLAAAGRIGPWIAKKRTVHPLKAIFYTPLDVDFLLESLTRGLEFFDKIVTYTHIERALIAQIAPNLEPKLKTIYLGTDMKGFIPLKDSLRKRLRKQLFEIDDDVFFLLNVNRNQFRKDLARSMVAIRELRKRIPNSMLYIHAAIKDAGGDLAIQAASCGLTGDEIRFPPIEFDSTHGLPQEALNEVYNCADLVVSTTTGEGWGLSLTEAMACKRPVLFPRNTACKELIGENEERGYLCKSGGSPTLYGMQYNNTNLLRPLTDVEDFVEKAVYIHDHPEEVKEKVNTAFDWLKNFTWDKQIDEWMTTIEEVMNG